MKTKPNLSYRCAAVLLTAQLALPAVASSHMDAPLITRDPAANTTEFMFDDGWSNLGEKPEYPQPPAMP